MTTTLQKDKKAKYPHCMNRLAIKASNNKKCAFMWLAFFLALAIGGIIFGDWVVGLATTLTFYAVFNFVIFSTVRPLDWEASILFLAFILAAAVFIAMFGGIYHVNQLIFTPTCVKIEGEPFTCNSATISDWYYYSTAVFTTLGFGDISPTTLPGKITTSIEALLGMAFGVTAIVIFLGRDSWFSTKGGSDTETSIAAAQPTISLNDHQLILQLFASQARELTELKRLVTDQVEEAKQTSKQIKKLHTTVWVTGLISFLFVIGIAGFALYIAKYL
jgi:hypothetical protein